MNAEFLRELQQREVVLEKCVPEERICANKTVQ